MKDKPQGEYPESLKMLIIQINTPPSTNNEKAQLITSHPDDKFS